MAKNGYKTLNLPASLVDELGIWKMAFTAAYGRPVSYGEMIRGMLNSLGNTAPGVVEELDAIVKRHPGLLDKLSVYGGMKGENLVN
jgi:hypothetical protein